MENDPLATWYNAVGPGWRAILEKLSAQLASEGVIPEQVAQVKEKFGGLRVYLWTTEGQRAQVDDYIDAAEEAADLTCERCGAQRLATEPAWPQNQGGWIKTLCPTCFGTQPERWPVDTGGEG